MQKPNKIRIELDIEPKYTEDFETLKELNVEVDGIKDELLKIIDNIVTPIINEKVHSVELNVADKRIWFIYP